MIVKSNVGSILEDVSHPQNLSSYIEVFHSFITNSLLIGAGSEGHIAACPQNWTIA